MALCERPALAVITHVARYLLDRQIHRPLPPKVDHIRSKRGTHRRKKDVDRRACEPPTMSARRQVESTLGRHVGRISALTPDHPRLARAHPLGLAELVPQTQSAFHPRAQQSAFRRLGARPQQRLLTRWN